MAAVTASRQGRAATQMLRLIQYYQTRVSVRRGARCRYRPTCSEYMKVTVESFGAVRGVWYGTLRLASCGPWSRRPIEDPPPRRPSSR